MQTVTAITVYNARLTEDRREAYLPTTIASASLMTTKGASHSGGIQTDKTGYKLRIPYVAKVQDSRIYIDEASYKALDDETAAKHWTLQVGDYVVLGSVSSDAMTAQELQTMAEAARLDLIQVVEYADNTIRGSDAVKHWRIGGE